MYPDTDSCQSIESDTFDLSGLEMRNPSFINLNLLAYTPYKRIDAASFTGFIIDYSTPKGYTRRVMFSVGMSDSRRQGGSPSWGTQKDANKNGAFQIVELGIQPFYNIDVRTFAPGNWDGKIWLTQGVQNTGANTLLKTKMTKPFN